MNIEEFTKFSFVDETIGGKVVDVKFSNGRYADEKYLYDIQQRILEEEENTRQEKSFTLPSKINGKELKWP